MRGRLKILKEKTISATYKISNMALWPREVFFGSAINSIIGKRYSTLPYKKGFLAVFHCFTSEGEKSKILYYNYKSKRKLKKDAIRFCKEKITWEEIEQW